MKKILLLFLPPIVLIIYKNLKFAFLKNQFKTELKEKLKIIQTLKPDQIENTKHIENYVLPQLGLNGTTNYNFEIFPKELKPHLLSGLRIWQYPNQFAQFLVEISKLNIEYYLEIGMENGGSFIVIVEFLKFKNHGLIAYGVDYRIYNNLKVYAEINQNTLFWEMDSHSKIFKIELDNFKNLDLVFIDGDHTYYGVESDFNLVKDKARHIAFHDIVDFNCNGVRDFWTHLKDKYKNEYYFKEFTEQYPEVLKNTDKTFLGIGLMSKKEDLTG